MPDGFGRAKRCIILFLYGSPSQMETVDMKPGAPLEIRGTRLQPTMTLQGGIRDGKVEGVALQRVNLTGNYASRRALGRLEVLRDSAPVLGTTIATSGKPAGVSPSPARRSSTQ